MSEIVSYPRVRVVRYQDAGTRESERRVQIETGRYCGKALRPVDARAFAKEIHDTVNEVLR